MSSYHQWSRSKSFSALLILLSALCIAVLSVSLAEVRGYTERWTRINVTAPSARKGHAMAYDAARGQAIVFGGMGSPNTYRDTWAWDGSSWTEVAASGEGPSARWHSAMVYDSVRERIVLFGGWASVGAVGDTWEWDGSSWTEIFPSTSPTARYGHEMAYDPVNEVVVLFGGYDGDNFFNDTWLYTGSTGEWSRVYPATSPDPRRDFAMTYDAAHGYVMLQGGTFCDGRDYYFDELWFWNGTDWSMDPHIYVPRPAARSNHAMVYDSANRCVVHYGGHDASGLTDSTYLWTGSGWQLGGYDKPTACSDFGMAYDSRRNRTVLFGGASGFYPGNATWEYDLDFDLKIRFRKAQPTVVGIGGEVKLIAVVKNVGEGDSLPTIVYFYLSTDRVLDESDIYMGGVNASALAPGSRGKVKKKLPVPASASPGFYYVIVRTKTPDIRHRNNVSASRNPIQVY